jgi:hypothetical protein
MLLDKTVKVKVIGKTKKYYEALGYECKCNEYIDVDIKHLSKGSNVPVRCLCDYCLEDGITTVIEKSWHDYNLQNISGTINKDCCSKCVQKKIKESNIVNYGVEHTSSLDTTKDKMKNTNIERYGGIAPINNDNIKNKINNTNINKYGVITPSKNNFIKDKIINTNISRYGSSSPTLNNNVRKKQLNTMLEKYDALYPMQNDLIQNKARISLYNNNTAPCSRQQRYICDLIKGKLNYPFNNLGLDIAFPDEKIYVECDFGGHELQVKFGNKTEEEFKNDEKRRWYVLYRNGWKEIRIISKTDKIPSDSKILDMIEYAKLYFNSGRHYIKFDIDTQKVICSQYENYYDYGELRRIY